jgi:hypothetical protein
VQFGYDTETMTTPIQDPSWQIALAAELRDADGRPLQRERPTSLETEVAEVHRLLVERDLTAPFVVQGGGTQAVFRTGIGVTRALSELADRMHPYRWQFGIGFGTFETRPDAVSGLILDGSCLDRARAALWTARRDRRSAVCVGFGSPEDSTLATILELIDQIRGRWTRRQAETVRAARTAKGKEVAASFGVSPSVVSESLKAASFKPLLRAEKSLTEAFERFGTEGSYRGDRAHYPDLTSPISSESRRLVARR